MPTNAARPRRSEQTAVPPPWRTRPDTVAVAVGSALGTAARALVGVAVPADAGAWPWATLAVNVLGAFVLGAVVGRIERGRAPAWMRGPGFSVGVVGSFTTFSAVAVDLARLAPTSAVAYAAASLGVGSLCVALGWRVGRGRS